LRMTENTTTNYKADYMEPALADDNINEISSLGLAHIGDAVYELMARTWLVTHGKLTSRGLHNATVEIVRAQAQAQAVRGLFEKLSEEEQTVYRRGRNTRTHSVPRGAQSDDYHAATGLEALIGWLYLKHRRDRINELFEMIMEAADAS